MKMACERKVKKLKNYEEEFIANKELTDKEQQVFKQYDLKFNDERLKLKAETVVLQATLDAVVERTRIDEKKSGGILQDYKQIIQRQEEQITKLNSMLEDTTVTNYFSFSVFQGFKKDFLSIF